MRLLDYGCGDGTFLNLLASQPGRPKVCGGAEVLPQTVMNCRERVRGDNVNFVVIDELEQAEYCGAYDAVFCMEVLEHMVDVGSVLDRLTRLLKPGGKLIISVPVESGVPLLIKQAVRRIAGWRGIGDYPGTTSYTLTELSIGLFANGKRQHLTRPVHQNGDGSCVHDHKGFNWMLLRNELRRRFLVETVFGSPLPWLTPHLASQVWFVASRRR